MAKHLNFVLPFRFSYSNCIYVLRDIPITFYFDHPKTDKFGDVQIIKKFSAQSFFHLYCNKYILNALNNWINNSSLQSVSFLVHQLVIIAEFHPQSPCHFAWQLSARASQTLRSSYLSHILAAPTQAHNYWQPPPLWLENTLIYAYTISRTA
jgi:hypothetical protein